MSLEERVKELEEKVETLEQAIQDGVKARDKTYQVIDDLQKR